MFKMAQPTVNVAGYLANQKKTTNKELASEWAALEDLYNEKLWNELTIKLNKFVRNAAMQDEDALLQLYQNFLQT
ncbi:26S proteasome non-ATPase regulatory subunit 13 [Lucilia cuprina]|nr:26S proteasome non-ATPase regulatory subunit 13 [Lucilia cuprina]KAI8118384.1 26S proteasome non-ATPase regulatory subunit 13 [Lucilia cuprina]